MKWKWGIEIEAKATIGPGFQIFHYGGIFIGGAAIIGKNFTITQNVVIGTRGENDGVPHIGDNVSVSPGANLSGAIRIGNNVRIGPNAVVTKNIPDNALVHSFPVQVVVFSRRYGRPGTKALEG
jgi:serine O-acetyltransferase